MKLKVIRIKTSVNKFSVLSTDGDFTKLEYRTIPKVNRIHYNLYFITTNAVIKAGMWVVVTNYEDGDMFTEKCKSIANENGRLVFHGEEGTRCLLTDCELIIASSDHHLVNEVAVISDDFLKEYVNSQSPITEVEATLDTTNTYPQEITIISKQYLPNLEFDENSELPF